MCPRLFHPSAWLETSSDAPTAITRLKFLCHSQAWEAKHTCLRARLPLGLENNLRRRASRRHAGLIRRKPRNVIALSRASPRRNVGYQRHFLKTLYTDDKPNATGAGSQVDRHVRRAHRERSLSRRDRRRAAPAARAI